MYTYLVIVASIFASCPNAVNGQHALFDLEIDPFETSNVYDHPAYSSVQELLHRRLEYFRDNVTTNVVIAEAENLPTFKRAGGVVPWLSEGVVEEPVPMESVPIPGAPNIVMVVLDGI